MPELTPLDDNRQEHFLNGEDLEPITRREHFYAGRESELPEGHQEPETREEWFIQKYRGGGGGDITVESLSVTSNGTYTAPSGKAYSPVEVNVPLPQNAYLLKSVTTPTPIASFNDGANLSMPSLKVAIEPVQSGSGDPSPTNIRHISGWDEVNVGVVGKNLFDIHIDKDTAYTNIILDNPLDQTFTVSAVNNNVAVSESVWRIGFVYKNNEVYYVGDNGYQRPFPQTIIATESNPIVKIQYRGQTMTSGSYDVQIELGSQATTYEPYNGHTYTIDLDGTRYGGTLDVISGVLTVDRVGVDMGTLTWSVSGSSSQLFSADLTSKAQADGLCEVFIVTDKTNPNHLTANELTMTGSKIYCYNGGTWETAEDFTTAMNGKLLCYELATPLTIQLSPTAVKSLLGVNNVYANTGDITHAEYFSKEV